MAQTFVTTSGTLVIPGAYSTLTVQASNSGLSTNGVIFLVGESDAGPDFTQESDLNSNAFGPDQLADVQAKYKSGNLVDAFRGAQVPSADDDVSGSFSRAILVKTNPSASASAGLLRYNASAYATLQDRSFGKLGNLISYQVAAKTSERIPTTGNFAFLPPIASTNIEVRVNGGAATPITVGVLSTPPTFAAQIDAITGVDITGGADLTVLTGVTGTLALAVVSGNAVTVTRSVNFNGTLPSPGDTMYIPSGSVLATANAAAAGSYIVTGSTALTINATKLLDVTGAANALTPPTAKSATASAATTDVQCFSAMSIHLVIGANPIDGTGKTLEIAELSTATGRISYNCYVPGPTPATFMSKTGAANVLTSVSEYQAELIAARQVDGGSDDLSAGGQVALAIGYLGTTASAVNDGTNLTLSVTGGAGTSPAAIPLKNFPTIADLSSYISSLTGFTAAPGTAVIGSQPSTSLDQGTFTFSTSWGGTSGRIKQDAYRFYNTLLNNGTLVQLTSQASSGLPAPTTGVAFLAGGSKGSTTDAIFQAAIAKLAMCRGNFLAPLFSRDASADIIDGLTEAASSYTIAGVHSASRAHVLQMSTLKAKRNRQAFLSYRGTFANAQTTAANLANSRCSLSFQDVKDLGANGVQQFQPWMGAAKAASFQAAAGYKSIFAKVLNISGAVQAAGDFNDQDDTAVENALLAGLLTMRRDETGAWQFTSDQDTYGKDASFFYNSIQMVYAGDLVALTTSQRMQKAFTGKALADVSASLGLTTLDGIMADIKRLKLISPSDDAPNGYKDAKIQIVGPAMLVSLNVKVTGSIYFIPISFTVSQVTQSA